jgi:hypothetical protein
MPPVKLAPVDISPGSCAVRDRDVLGFFASMYVLRFYRLSSQCKMISCETNKETARQQ